MDSGGSSARPFSRSSDPGQGIEGNVIVSVPWDALPTMVEDLREMPFVPPAYEDGTDTHSERFKRVTGH
jgi:hypothetical protein